MESFEEANGWLKRAVTNGHYGEMWEGGYPRYLWYRDGELVYEARLVNRVSGEYKGYPLERDEIPRGI